MKKKKCERAKKDTRKSNIYIYIFIEWDTTTIKEFGVCAVNDAAKALHKVKQMLNLCRNHTKIEAVLCSIYQRFVVIPLTATILEKQNEENGLPMRPTKQLKNLFGKYQVNIQSKKIYALCEEWPLYLYIWHETPDDFFE